MLNSARSLKYGRNGCIGLNRLRDATSWRYRRHYTEKPPRVPTDHETPFEPWREKFQQISKDLSKINAITQKDLKDLVKEMERRRYNINQVKMVVGLVGVTFIYLSGKQIKNYLSSQTAEVTQQSMDDPDFQNKIKQLSAQVSREVLSILIRDTQLRQDLTDYTREILTHVVLEIYERQDFIDKTETVTRRIINSKQVEITSTELAKNVAQELINDPEMQKMLGTAIKNATISGFTPWFLESEQSQNN